MKIRFDPDFDGGAWPGPLGSGDREASAGEAWLGELGFVDRLETALGLGGPTPTAGERAAALVPALRQTDGFWSASVEVDPLGSARELLRWRDELVFSGWRGDTRDMPDRVVAMAQLSGALLAGIPDRIWQIEQTLKRRSAEVARLDLLEPANALPLAWRAVIAGLALQGTQVEDLILEPVATSVAKSDLSAARVPGLQPKLDGSLQLLRPDGPWSAAVEVAAWLATRTENLASTDDRDSVVIISPTPLLDTELRRFGLPTTGAGEPQGGSTLLEILPLVLALGWKPAAPEDAVALLSLPESPVPRAIRNRLLRALAEWPAVGSGMWNEEIKKRLEAIDNTARRDRECERLDAIFSEPVERRGRSYPVAEIRKRTALVRNWLHGRRGRLNDPENITLVRAIDAAVSQCAAFERIVGLAGLENWGPADIQRFLDEARHGLAAETVYPAEAGLASVAAPGAIAGPARCVVWWNFSRHSAPRFARIPFTPKECAALEAAGIALPSPADRAVRHAQRWRRPLDQTSEALILVSPRANEAGDESHPHPLWDEIGARLDGDQPQRAEHDVFRAGAPYAQPRARRAQQPLVPPPAPAREWRVPAELLPLPDRASNSEVEDMLRCSMRWALGRVARLRGIDEIDVGISGRSLGKLAHALLEAVLPDAGNDRDKAHQLAIQWFDDHAPTHMAALFLPGHEADATRVRRILADSAARFTAFTHDAGLELQTTEQTIEGSGLGRTLFGIPDLVLGPKPVVVDAKWGGFNYRRRALETGTATQLAFYAHLLGQQADAPPEASSVAFFVLSGARILTTDEDLGGGALTVDGPSHAETWLALERGFDERKAQLARGLLLATANPDENGDGPAKDDAITQSGAVALKPNCMWCDFGGLCGAALIGVQR